jgi:hypothetical protein
MIYQIPLRKVPNQKLDVELDGQQCGIRLVTRLGRLFCGLTVDDATVWDGIIVRDRLPLKQSRMQLLRGDLMFVDTEGKDDPRWAKLGDRFVLAYFGEGEEFDPNVVQIPIKDLTFV